MIPREAMCVSHDKKPDAIDFIQCLTRIHSQSSEFVGMLTLVMSKANYSYFLLMVQLFVYV